LQGGKLERNTKKRQIVVSPLALTTYGLAACPRRPKPLRVKDLGKENNYEFCEEGGGTGESLPLNPLPLGYPYSFTTRKERL
tara:strand:+ start:895 stop:1140 length:246 start_codon:yes stop_codon:yes gene_type:complete